LLVGDGRTGRLLMTYELIHAGYPLPVIRGEDQLAYLQVMSDARGGNFAALTELVAAAVQRSSERYLSLLDRG